MPLQHGLNHGSQAHAARHTPAKSADLHGCRMFCIGSAFFVIELCVYVLVQELLYHQKGPLQHLHQVQAARLPLLLGAPQLPLLLHKVCVGNHLRMQAPRVCMLCVVWAASICSSLVDRSAQLHAAASTLQQPASTYFEFVMFVCQCLMPLTPLPTNQLTNQPTKPTNPQVWSTVHSQRGAWSQGLRMACPSQPCMRACGRATCAAPTCSRWVQGWACTRTQIVICSLHGHFNTVAQGRLTFMLATAPIRPW